MDLQDLQDMVSKMDLQDLQDLVSKLDVVSKKADEVMRSTDDAFGKSKEATRYLIRMLPDWLNGPIPTSATEDEKAERRVELQEGLALLDDSIHASEKAATLNREIALLLSDKG